MKEGRKIGPWTLGHLIGSGGQSRVYEASKDEGSEIVALKIINTPHLKKAARFIQEVQTHAELSAANAENIIPILDHQFTRRENAGVDGYIAMPRARWSLETAINLLQGRVELCLEVFEGIVNGIYNAQSRGIIHRDIKPANVLFMDETLRKPMVCDFGICFLKETPDEVRITEARETVGAKFFMAPEQERGGRAEVTDAADVYALGKLLHHMVTGRFLHREHIEEAFEEEETGQDPRLIKIKAEILEKTIIEKVADRIQSAGELLQIVRKLRAEFGAPSGDPLKGARSSQAGAQASENGKTRLDNQLGGTGAPVEFQTACQAMVSGRFLEVALQFDSFLKNFNDSWNSLHSAIRGHPEKAPEAALQILDSQTAAANIHLAIARCDSTEGFIHAKRFIEEVSASSKGIDGYPEVFTVPHVLSGFLYMTTAVMSFNWRSWQVFRELLTQKFEWYYQSQRPLFSYGFALPYFFHPQALDRNGPRAHDLYRQQLEKPQITQVTRLQGESLLNIYLQVQMIMCLKGAQLLEQEMEIRMWPDFGRFHEFRVIPLLDRMYSDATYADGILKSFSEPRDRFFQQLNPRLEVIRKRFWGSPPYFWESITEWEPR